MTKFDLALICFTPLWYFIVWHLLFNIFTSICRYDVFGITDYENKEASMVGAFILTLALWGVYLLVRP